MQKFTTLTGIAAYLPMINVDTDMIIPKQYLKTIKRTGLGKGLFAELRYDEKGVAHPDFVLHKPPYTQATDSDHRREFRLRVIARARAVGSARFRHQVHHRAVLRRHLLQQLLQERHFAHHAAAGGDRQADRRCVARGQRTLTIDLPAQEIRGPDGGVIKFDVDPHRKRCLMEGLDDIGLTMEKADAIADFEGKSRTARPWA